MKVKVIYIDKLLEELSAKTQQGLDNKGFEEMEIIIDNSNINKKYLYEYMYLKATKARKENIVAISANVSKLDILTNYARGITFRSFTELYEKEQRSKPLLSCIGNYYCYVRGNRQVGVLLRSPVRISDKSGKIGFELQGGRWKYDGVAELKNGCLFVLMKGSGGKEIHHVYKIGIGESPNVLQGVFSAVSSTSEPIGGRCVLIRKEERYENLKIMELRVQELRRSKKLEDRRLAEYFEKYEDNNLSIKKVDTFRIDDLGKCR